jgi:hypothetical protein
VMKTRPAALALALLLGLSLAGCSSTAKPPAASSTAPSQPSSSSTPPATADPADEAKSQAVAHVTTYLSTIDDLYIDSSRPLDDLYAVAVAPEATAEASAIGTFRAQGYRQTGRSQLLSASVDSVDLTNDPAASPSPKLPSVLVTACVDVSQVQATDQSGASVVPGDRPRYLVQHLTVVNAAYPDASSWRVAAAPNTQAQSCDE